jgi:argininosuccinate lyase
MHLALAVNTEMILALTLREDRCAAAAADPMLLATDLADYLVKNSVPFRQAHEIIGKLVAFSIKQKRGFAQLKLTEFQRFWKGFSKDVYDVLNLSTALEARKGIGAPSPQNVRKQLDRWRKQLEA